MNTFRLPFAGRAALILACCLPLAGCDLITRALEAIGLAQERTVRISGFNYFKLDRKDPRDGAGPPINGYMCVVHDPGCGGSGNDGEDTFFLTTELSPLATVTGFEFTPIPPAGMAENYTGPFAPSGTFGTRLQPGALDGRHAIRIRWNNTCWGPYGGRPAVYRVTMTVKVRGNVDFGELEYDPDERVDAPPCRSDAGGTVVTTRGPSGWGGAIYVCNPFNVFSTLHIEAELDGTATGTNKATMVEDIPVRFTQSGNAWSANFKTQQVYQPGSWKLKAATLEGDFGPLPGLPRPENLPGGVGAPVLDFTGGRCRPQ